MPDPILTPRQATHLDAAARALRLVHEHDGYPVVWPEDPAAWLAPQEALAAWVALAEASADADEQAVVGHVLLVPGSTVEFADDLARAAGVTVAGLAGVGRLFVTPSARGAGIAAALLRQVQDAAAQRGLRLALDVVDDGGPAMRVYERLGWERVTSGPAGWTRPDGVRPQAAAYLSPR